MNVLVKTREVNGKKEYLCPICEVYEPGVLINVTGYTELECPHCGSTLPKIITATRNGRINTVVCLDFSDLTG